MADMIAAYRDAEHSASVRQQECLLLAAASERQDDRQYWHDEAQRHGERARRYRSHIFMRTNGDGNLPEAV